MQLVKWNLLKFVNKLPLYMCNKLDCIRLDTFCEKLSFIQNLFFSDYAKNAYSMKFRPLYTICIFRQTKDVC